MSHRCSAFVFLVALFAPFSGRVRSEQDLGHARAQANQATGGRRLTVVGLPNFAEVTPGLYRGGQPTPRGFRKLAGMGVNLVVDFRLSGKDTEKREVEELGMTFVAMPWHCLVPRDDIFHSFLELLRTHPKKKVFVHCRYGDDRTGMAVAAYRMAIDGWTAEQARREMDQFGFHPLTCPSLIEYERKFPERLKHGGL